MSDNPYASPKARVADIEIPSPPRVRPVEVGRAIQVLWISYIIGFLVLIASWEYNTSLQSPTAIVLSQCFSFLIAFWLSRKILQGRNWARIVMLVLALLSLGVASTSAFAQILSSAPLLVKGNLIVSSLLQVYMLWLLFISPGRRWFQPNTSA